jgi:conjugal transfer mating pair stabilization protein TraG
MFESFAGMSVFGEYGGKSGPLRQQLLMEHGGEVGADIADLLKQAASQNRGDLAGLVGQYNHAMEGVEDFSSNAAEYKKKDSHTTPDALKPIFKEVEGRLDLPPGLLEKMAFAESSWDTHAVSAKGASGLMQLMPDTARRFHVDDPTDPKQAIEGAGRYMRWLLDRYDGNLEKAVAAYNAGEGRVDEHNGVPPIAETREYVKKVLK